MSTGESKIDKSNVVITIRGLQKSFGSLAVLRGIDLDVFQGENVAVLGRSGSGKSVLIKIIVGLLSPDSGKINVLGSEVTALSSRQLQTLRLKIGFSFQNSALYDSMTVKENLEFPLVRNRRNLTRREVDDAIKEVLEGVGLLDTINKMPAELSGGQRKRIGIARTLILRPEVMLYDEPTSGLDPITSIEINKLINQVQEQYNTSAIIITHDLTCAKSTGDRVAMLVNGRFATIGSFNEVFDTTDADIRGFYDYNFFNNKPQE